MKKSIHALVVMSLLLRASTLTVLPLIALYSLLPGCTSSPHAKNKIIVEATFSKYFHRELTQVFTIGEEISLRYLPFPSSPENPAAKSITGKVTDGKVQWVVYSDSPIRVLPPYGTSFVMNPGDSVHILYQKNYPIYSGNNMPVMALLDSLMQLEDRVLPPHKKYSYMVGNMDDFRNWNQYLEAKSAMQLPVIESFKDQLTPAEYEHYKAEVIGNLEADRMHAFAALYGKVYKGQSGLTNSDLIQLWDSIVNNPSRQWLMSLSAYNGSIYDIYTYAWMEVHRQYGFDSTKLIQSKDNYTHTVYNNAKQKYKDRLRERLLVRILDEEVILEMGLKNSTAQVILKDYYSQPGYPEFKAYIKELEKKKQLRALEKEKKDKEKKTKPAAEQAEEKLAG